MSADAPAGQGGKQWVIAGGKFAAEQRRHFIFTVALPTAVALAGLVWLPAAAFSWFGILLWLVMWTLVGGLGISVGFHRQFAHRSYACSNTTRLVLRALGSMAGQGSVTYWTAIHRRHHALADWPGDPHSPTTRAHELLGVLRAFLRGHVGWAWRHDVPKVSRYAKDLLADPVANRLGKLYWPLFVAGLLIPGLAGMLYWGPIGLLYGIYWGGAVRIAVGHQIIWSINSLGHSVGGRPATTGDYSGNVPWLAMLSFGEGWHNNHHARPVAARFSRTAYQVDPGWLLMRAMMVCGVKLEVRQDA